VTQQSDDRLATLHRISQTFNSSLDLEEVLSRVIDEVIEITHGERGFLMLREPDGSMAFKAARGLDHQTIDFALNRNHGLYCQPVGIDEHPGLAFFPIDQLQDVADI
jgi:GAF domain-containing protein